MQRTHAEYALPLVACQRRLRQSQQGGIVGESKALDLTFSSDSRRVYGVRPDQDHNYLFSVDVAGGQEKIIGDIGKDFTPRSNLTPGLRLSLSPDGKSILFPSLRQTSSLWMLEGFDPPGWAMELREMLPW